MQNSQGASKQIDVEYVSPASSERFQYQLQNEKQKLLHVGYASLGLSEKLQYKAYNEEEKPVNAKSTSSYTLVQTRSDIRFKFPCGLF